MKLLPHDTNIREMMLNSLIDVKHDIRAQNVLKLKPLDIKQYH